MTPRELAAAQRAHAARVRVVSWLRGASSAAGGAGALVALVALAPPVADFWDLGAVALVGPFAFASGVVGGSILGALLFRAPAEPFVTLPARQPLAQTADRHRGRGTVH